MHQTVLDTRKNTSHSLCQEGTLLIVIPWGTDRGQHLIRDRLTLTRLAFNTSRGLDNGRPQVCESGA